jgi:hypothetical protein
MQQSHSAHTASTSAALIAAASSAQLQLASEQSRAAWSTVLSVSATARRRPDSRFQPSELFDDPRHAGLRISTG